MSTNGPQQQNRPQQAAQVSDRASKERTERRRREDLGSGRLRNLAITGNIDPNYEYRFINDDPGRVFQLTQQDDWDLVNSEDLNPNAKDKGVGTPVERVVDKRSGKKAVLVRKRKDWYLADKAKEQASIDETEASLKRGVTPSPEGLSAKEGARAYVPQGGIAIQSERSGGSYTP